MEGETESRRESETGRERVRAGEREWKSDVERKQRRQSGRERVWE